MKIMLMAAAGVLCIGVGAAYADGGDDEGGAVANTYFSELPGVVATAAGQQPNNVAANSYYTAPNTSAAVVAPSTATNSGS